MHGNGRARSAAVVLRLSCESLQKLAQVLQHSVCFDEASRAPQAKTVLEGCVCRTRLLGSDR